MQWVRKDETGNRYGNLTVISYEKTVNYKAYWRCKCDCGNIVVAWGVALRCKNTKSCGCLKRKLWVPIPLDNNTLKIPLSNGGYSLIDFHNFEKIKNYSWRNLHGYVVTHMRREYVAIHQLILNAQKGLECDHINGNGLDNRESNLRVATKNQNMGNVTVRKDNILGKKGIHCQGNRYIVRIQANKKRHYLGCYDSQVKAEEAYKQASLKLHGDYSVFNRNN